jgi:excisionase family DNA binding protein
VIDRTLIEKRWLSYEEAALYTGLSEESLRKLVVGKRLTLHRPTGGRRVLFDIHQLDALLENSVETTSVLGQEDCHVVDHSKSV